MLVTRDLFPRDTLLLLALYQLRCQIRVLLVQILISLERILIEEGIGEVILNPLEQMPTYFIT